VGTDDRRFIAFDVGIREIRADTDIGELPIKIAVSPAKVAVYILDATGRVTVLNPLNFEPVETLQASAGGMDLAVSGTRLLVADGSSRTIRYYDAVTRDYLGGVSTSSTDLHHIRTNTHTDRAYVIDGSPRNAILILDAKVPELIDAIPTNEPYYLLELAPGRSHAFALVPDSKVKMLDLRWLSSGRELARIETGKFPVAIAPHVVTQRAM
jgi:DNA-binding beta-propeller fold protein YncE